MAKFYGKNSSYLLKNDLKYYAWGAGLVLFPLFLVWASLKIFEPGVTLAVTLVSVVFVAKLSEPFIDFFKRKSGQFFRGFSGELDIKRALQDLPDTFSVFQDVMIGEGKGNLDFVVVGPRGVFNLEVKSHKGRIGFNGRELTINGKTFRDKNLLRQVHGQTFALKNYLRQQTGTDVYVHSVIVFSSDYASVHFGLQPIQNVHVIQKHFLLNLIYSFKASEASQKTVESVLLDVV